MKEQFDLLMWLNEPNGEEKEIILSGYNIELNNLIAAIEEQQIDITTSYDDWLKIGFALADELKKAGRESFTGSVNFIINMMLMNAINNILNACNQKIKELLSVLYIIWLKMQVFFKQMKTDGILLEKTNFHHFLNQFMKTFLQCYSLFARVPNQIKNEIYF